VKVLLDTNVFLKWAIGERLPGKVERLISSVTRDLLISIITAWEIALKQNKFHAKGLTNARIADAINLLGAQVLPILLKHIDTLSALPLHHQDPFDRMLIAQAISENAIVLSSDERFPLYRPAGLQVRWN